MFRFDWRGHAIARVLCLGAHADDIEIGCGGTLFKLIEGARRLVVRWIVFSADGQRAQEAFASASALLAGVEDKDIVIHKFRDGFFPSNSAELKDYFEELKRGFSPDLILTHYHNDLHQDHRLISDLTWNTFRSHQILEYEIPKYDGDFGSPNVFVHLDEPFCRRKIDHVLRSFPSQAHRHWFSEDLFRSVLRIRGMEANASSTYAEGFYARKVTLDFGQAARVGRH
jgi:LmbE family N-acetylglucosaminyl deacetylase